MSEPRPGTNERPAEVQAAGGPGACPLPGHASLRRRWEGQWRRSHRAVHSGCGAVHQNGVTLAPSKQVYVFLLTSMFVWLLVISTVQRDVGPDAAGQAEAASSPGFRQVHVLLLFIHGPQWKQSVTSVFVKLTITLSFPVFRQGGGSQRVSVQICCSSDSGQDRTVWSQGQQCGHFWETSATVFPPRTRLLAPRPTTATAGAGGPVERTPRPALLLWGDRGAQVRLGKPSKSNSPVGEMSLKSARLIKKYFWICSVITNAAWTVRSFKNKSRYFWSWQRAWEGVTEPHRWRVLLSLLFT